MKEFWKSVNIWGSYGQEFSVLFFETQFIYSFISPSYMAAENKYNKQKLNKRNKK